MAEATEALSARATRIELLPRIREDIDRIMDHLLEHGGEEIDARMDMIFSGLDLLESHPDIGRPVGHGPFRELVLGRGHRGYVALYEHVEPMNTVLVIALRSQREDDYFL